MKTQVRLKTKINMPKGEILSGSRGMKSNRRSHVNWLFIKQPQKTCDDSFVFKEEVGS